jgi:hypothetical protein
MRQLDELLAWGETQFSDHPLPEDISLNVLAQLTGATLGAPLTAGPMVRTLLNRCRLE